MEYIVFAGAIFLLIALLMGKEYLNSRDFRKKSLERLYQSYGMTPERNYKTGEMDHIQEYYFRHPKEHQIDDITWNDLNMDNIYQKINTSCSAAGDEYLYYRLRTPIYDREETERWESRIKFFMEHEDERQRVQSLFFNLGRVGRYSLHEYIENLDILGERNNLKYILSNLLLLVCIGVMFVSLPAGTVALLVVLCHNIVGYFKEYKQIEPYITSFRYINRMLDAADKMGKVTISGISEEQKRLRGCYQRMKGFIRNAYLIVYVEKGNGDPFGVLLDYLRMVFYLDLIQFNNALRAVRGHLSEIDEMVTLLGQIETAVVIGSYRNSLSGGYCIPTIRFEQNEDRHIEIEQVYHPMLTEPVKNSISTAKGVLLTGSNASGKSTFLRAVAVNALLAQTIHTCLADYYDAPFFRIYSSMALKDDLISGQSYYMVEIKSIKRILDQVQKAETENGYVLCFVDEVLRGTNTVERIAASTQIMKMLSSDHALCFAATHDVELTKLLRKEYDNYHFEERIEEDDIFFPYKLMQGPATTRNAIALLKMLGYDDYIIKEAETMAEGFLTGGSWQNMDEI
ncbi:MAG: hypothetical protein K2J99_08555 [Lachnospiraceae bacterium]|nr:hypothetical protein [Lachnospiraceae bacterium]